MRYEQHIDLLVRQIFKMLPMMEDMNNGQDVHLGDHIESVCIEATGGFLTFPELYEDTSYVRVVNTLHYLHGHWETISWPSYRREVLKMLRFLKEVGKHG